MHIQASSIILLSLPLLAQCDSLRFKRRVAALSTAPAPALPLSSSESSTSFALPGAAADVPLSAPTHAPATTIKQNLKQASRRQIELRQKLEDSIAASRNRGGSHRRGLQARQSPTPGGPPTSGFGDIFRPALGQGVDTGSKRPAFTVPFDIIVNNDAYSISDLIVDVNGAFSFIRENKGVSAIPFNRDLYLSDVSQAVTYAWTTTTLVLEWEAIIWFDRFNSNVQKNLFKVIYDTAKPNKFLFVYEQGPFAPIGQPAVQTKIGFTTPNANLFQFIKPQPGMTVEIDTLANTLTQGWLGA